MNPNKVPASMRLKVEEHVCKILQEHYPHVIETVISSEASAIETNAFARAKSCSQYLAIVSSYNTAHQKRKTRCNDAYRIPKFTPEEELSRIAVLNSTLKDERGKIQRAIQGSVPSTSDQPNVQNAAQQTLIPPAQVFSHSNPQQNFQHNLQQSIHPVLAQQVLSQQPVAQPHIQPIAQPILQQQIPQPYQQMHANMINAQAINPAMVSANPQTLGMNIINHGNVQPVQSMQPMFATPAPNGINPRHIRYVFPPFPGAQVQAVQQPNAPASAQQIYYPIVVDPRFLAQASTNPMVIPNQASAPQAVSTPQVVPSTPNPAAGGAQSQSVPPVPNGAQFTDEMITQLAHQTAQAVAQSAPTAPAGRGTSPASGKRRSCGRQRKLAPNIPVSDQTGQDSEIATKHKSDLVAKWIHLQREYRPRIERIRSVLSMILKNPSPEQRRSFQELEGARSLLQAPVGKLMGEGYTEANYMKASAYLSQIVKKYKKFEEMSWSEVSARILHAQRAQQARNAQLQSSVTSAPHQLNEGSQTPLVREQPLRTPSLSNANQRTNNLQLSRPHTRNNGKGTTKDAQNEELSLSEVCRSEEEMRILRSRAAAAIARRHRMNTASFQKKAGSTGVVAPQQHTKQLSKANNALPRGAQNQDSGPVKGSPSGATTEAEAAKQALVSKAGDAAMAAARASFNARKRPASQMEMTSPTDKGPLPKKASMSHIAQSVTNSSTRTYPGVQGTQKISLVTGEPHPKAQKQTKKQELKKPTTFSAPRAEKIQKVVQEHVRSNVTQHVHKHIKAAISTRTEASMGNTNRVGTGSQSQSVTGKRQEQVEPPKEVTQSQNAETLGPDKQPRTAEQEQPETRVLSVPNPEPLEQEGSVGRQVSNRDPSFNRFPTGEIVRITGLSTETANQTLNTSMNGNESGGQTDGSHVAEREVDFSALDNVDLNPLSPTDIVMAMEESMLKLKRVLHEDPFAQEAMEDATDNGIDDEEALELFQAVLDGEDVPRNRPLRVEETLKALKGTPPPKRVAPEPKPPPKPKSTKKLTLNDQVKEECKAFEENCNFIKCELHQEYKKPVILCKTSLEEIMVPNLVFRAFKGYPSKGNVSFSFQEPSMGWVGPLKEIRSSFMAAMATFDGDCSIRDVLEAWKSAIRDVTGQKEGGNS